MGHAHGLCKGSYACPHDAGSEGAKAYHEGYKHGLDEACGMGIKNEPIAGMEIGSLETLIDAIEKIISKAVAQGVVGMKDHAAYSRGLSYGLPNRREAEKELQLLPSISQNYEDVFQFHELDKLNYLQHHLTHLWLHYLFCL